MSEFSRAVQVDQDGYFVRAYQWPSAGGQPTFLKNGRTLLKEDYAVENVQENARWDFTPVFEDREVTWTDDTQDPPVEVTETRPVRVRSGTWLLPTVKRWVVLVRPDRPRRASYLREALVWPERMPPLPDGQLWIDVDPGPRAFARSLLFNLDSLTWMVPTSKNVCDASGIIVNRTVDYGDPEDLAHVVPDGGFAVADADLPDGQDEIENTVKPRFGDQLTDDGQGGYTCTVLRRPNYVKVPVRLLKKALQDAGELAAFVTFIEGKGYTVEDIDRLGTISLANKTLREFVTAQGYTLKQAYNALQRAAETYLAAEAAADADLGADE